MTDTVSESFVLILDAGNRVSVELEISVAIDIDFHPTIE